MKSKTEIKKPNIYIAKNMVGSRVTHTALELAEAIECNPFIDKIFVEEALFDKYSSHVITPETLKQLQKICVAEMNMADILIADMRDGEPVELGYAVETGKPIVLFNPDEQDVSTLIYGVPHVEILTLDELGEYNYLNIMLQGD